MMAPFIRTNVVQEDSFRKSIIFLWSSTLTVLQYFTPHSLVYGLCFSLSTSFLHCYGTATKWSLLYVMQSQYSVQGVQASIWLIHCICASLVVNTTYNAFFSARRRNSRFRIFGGLWFGEEKPFFSTFLKPFVETLKRTEVQGNSLQSIDIL